MGSAKAAANYTTTATWQATSVLLPKKAVQMLRRTALLAMLLAITGQPAAARSLRIAGTAGHLSEWRLDGTANEKKSAGAAEFSGSLTWTHVGVCSVNGLQEKGGTIDFQLVGAGSLAHIRATLRLEGTECTYDGVFSDSMRGLMDCSNATGVPLTLSIR
jgi:hypothetical protein